MPMWGSSRVPGSPVSRGHVVTPHPSGIVGCGGYVGTGEGLQEPLAPERC